MTATTWPSSTGSPSPTRSSSTVPAAGAGMGISIFMDSTIKSAASASTAAPTDTSTFHTVPVISDCTSRNHGLGEVITALLAHGLQLTALVEHQSIPWEALPGQMVKGEDGEYRLREQPARLPLSYTLVAVKA